jgi:hypothetical protein
MTRHALLGLFLALAALPWPLVATATLGEPHATVEADRSRLEARRAPSRVTPRYVVHELVLQNGTIRQFARADGLVFAVAWSGAMVPDLDPLLGRFAADYRDAQPEPGPRTGRRSARVTGAEVVVETWGRMRAYRGRAWVPALLPEGVVADELE